MLFHNIFSINLYTSTFVDTSPICGNNDVLGQSGPGKANRSRHRYQEDTKQPLSLLYHKMMREGGFLPVCMRDFKSVCMRDFCSVSRGDLYSVCMRDFPFLHAWGSFKTRLR